MSEKTTELTFVPCTIQIQDPRGRHTDTYEGKEAVGTGLGYYITYPNEERLPYQYHITHIQSGLGLATYIECYDEQTVVSAIEEIIEGKLAEWTLPLDDLYASIENKEEMREILRLITERHEDADNKKHLRDFSFSYTIEGSITIRSTSREYAEKLAYNTLRDIKLGEDNDEEVSFTVNDIDLD